MDTKPFFARPLGAILIAAALSFLAAIGLFSAVAGSFLHDGTPLEQVVIAVRACNDLAFVSERDACVRSFLAGAYHRRVASR